MPKLKIAAVGDLHYRPDTPKLHLELLKMVCLQAHILVLCGDLTDQGLPEEAQILAADLKNCSIPIVAVLGNHDYTSGNEQTVKQILKQEGNVHILEDQPFEYQGIGFAGVKGFGGGFDEHMIASFGENPTKEFVKAAVEEALHLENALLSLETTKKVVAFHYSPIKETVIGESQEVYPFLGTSRLAEPLERFGATVAFHGHTHYGHPVGKTLNGVPVYNASLHVLKRTSPDRPFVLVEV